MGRPSPTRCSWATNALLIQYHDREWGVPVHDDRRLFEFLILEGAQAGLSWNTILQKREAFRTAFDHFDPAAIARYDARKVRDLLSNPGIIRNRLKIQAAVSNARAFLLVQKEVGSFDEYIWQFVKGRPIRNRWKFPQDVPCHTPVSDAMSQDHRLVVRESCRIRERTIVFVPPAGVVEKPRLPVQWCLDWP